MGTQEQERVYKGRLLPDKNGDFYFKYLYHFFYIGEKAKYVFCPKTYGMNNFCPWCYLNHLLWKGNKSDKEKAYNYKKNVRFVSNFFITHDPRDVDEEDPEKKVTGKVRLYEFPEVVEGKIKKEMTNDEEGYGLKVFDPEEGHDLILRIKAKKPDKNGKVWPDYGNTEFSRKPSAISDDSKKIKEIMNSVYDLSEYLQKMQLDWKTQEKLLKEEMVWDYVEDVFKKQMKDIDSNYQVDENDSGEKEKDNPETKTQEDKTQEDKTQEDDGFDDQQQDEEQKESNTETKEDEDEDEESLLEELDNL